MRQPGSSTKVVTLILCLAIIIASYVVYRSVHATKSAAEEQKTVAAVQGLKTNEGKLLQTRLLANWKQTLSVAPPDGNVDIAVYDNVTGVTVQYTNKSSLFYTASLAKLSILETLLWHDQQQGLSSMPSGQQLNAAPMIEQSDNNAADALYLLAGGSNGLNAFFTQIGARDSMAEGDWGLTRTTALDQLKVIGEVAYPGRLLSVASANQAAGLLGNVETDQEWGVSGGVPTGVNVELKNGWIPGAELDGSNGWIVNSVGYVHGEGRNYTIAALTNENDTEEDGVNTIQMLSAATWNALGGPHAS